MSKDKAPVPLENIYKILVSYIKYIQMRNLWAQSTILECFLSIFYPFF